MHQCKDGDEEVDAELENFEMQASHRSWSQLEVTSHNFQTNQNMPRSEIPVDVLLNILEYVGPADLATMCRVNKICCSCSQDVLYHDTHAESPNALSPKVLQTLETLAQSTHLARKVRLFSSDYAGSDLAMALRNMTFLRSLKLDCAFNVDIFNGCTFKLESFECARFESYDELFPKFLSSQPSLKYLTLSGHFKFTGWSLEATCLPNLTRINVKFSWLPYLIPGRPLNEVIVTGSPSYGDSIDFSIFALSTTPLKNSRSLILTYAQHPYISWHHSSLHLHISR
jgi:F-box domain